MDGPSMAAMALGLIQNAGGTTVTLTSWASQYDPTTGIATRTPTSAQVTSTPPLPLSRTTRSADISARVAALIYIPAVSTDDTVPSEGMQVAIGTEEFTIVGVSTHTVGSTPVVYEVELAKGGEVVTP